LVDVTDTAVVYTPQTTIDTTDVYTTVVYVYVADTTAAR